MHVADKEKHCLNKVQNAHFCLTMSTLHDPVRFKRCVFCGFWAWSSAPHAWYYVDVFSYECVVKKNRLICDSRFSTVFLLPVICSQYVVTVWAVCLISVPELYWSCFLKRKLYLLNFRCAEKISLFVFLPLENSERNTRLLARYPAGVYCKGLGPCREISSCQQYWILPCALLKTGNSHHLDRRVFRGPLRFYDTAS
jgi:hypothetical protein